MTRTTTNIAVLGSTGSIGANTLEVVDASAGLLRAVALAARNSTQLLLEQARRFRPRWVVVTDAEAAQRQDWSELPKDTELLIGPEATCPSGGRTRRSIRSWPPSLAPRVCKAPGRQLKPAKPSRWPTRKRW